MMDLAGAELVAIRDGRARSQACSFPLEITTKHCTLGHKQ